MIHSIKGEKDIEWPSMTVPMDLQSAVDRVPWGRWRYVENFRAVQSGRLCRREGWRRFGWETEHPNSDLHDKHGSTDAITSLHVHQKNTRASAGDRLFAGAGRDIWMNRMDGGWNLVGTGNSGGQWSFGGVNDVIVAGNGTTVLWQRVGLEAFATNDTLEELGITGAGVVWQYQGCVFVADLVMDGVQVGHRVFWSNPDSVDFSQDLDSIAGFRDLTPGERVLAACPAGGMFLILTTKGAWRLGVADGAFVFQQLYFSKEGDACLSSRNAWACNREVCYYFATDGIYAISAFSSAPEWVEWVNKGIPEEFVGTSSCDLTASGYDTNRHELLFSSASIGKTFVINTRETSTSIIDKGFTAFVSAILDRSDDLVTWLARSGICTPEQIAAAYPLGTRDDARTLPAAEGTPGPCEAFNPPCGDACRKPASMLAVTSDDNCIKEVTENFYGRERRTSTGWVIDPYGSQIVTSCMAFGVIQAKRTNMVLVNFVAPVSDAPAKMTLTVGLSEEPTDPLAPTCRNKTHLFSQKTLACTTADRSPKARWTFMLDQRFIWYVLQIPAAVGGPVCLSRMFAGVARSPSAVE